eukprot:364708-Chlamydomonas_euryale.AAC.3
MFKESLVMKEGQGLCKAHQRMHEPGKLEVRLGPAQLHGCAWAMGSQATPALQLASAALPTVAVVVYDWQTFTLQVRPSEHIAMHSTVGQYTTGRQKFFRSFLTEAFMQPITCFLHARVIETCTVTDLLPLATEFPIA